MKVRKKWNRLFAVLLVAVMIFNSQATALLAMDETGTEVITETAEGSNTQTALEGLGADGEQTPALESAPPAPEEDAANPGTTPKESSVDPASTSEPVPASDPTPTQNSAPAPEPAPELNSESAPDSTIAPESTPAPDLALTSDPAPASDSASAPEGTPSDEGISAPDQVQSDDLQDDQGIAPDDGSINEGSSSEENIAPEQNVQNEDVQSEPVQGEEEKTGSDEDMELSSAQKSESELNAAEEKETESETGTGSEMESESEVDVVMAEETEPAPVPELDPANEISYDAEVVALGLDNEISPSSLSLTLPEGLPSLEDVKCDRCREKYQKYIEADDAIYSPDAQIIDSAGNMEWHYLECAVDCVKEGQTIELFANYDWGIMGNFNFNLRGKDITLDLKEGGLSYDCLLKENVPTITVKDTVGGGSLTIANGTIEGNSASESEGLSAGCIHVENANIILDEVTILGGKYEGSGGSAIYQNGGSLTMRNVEGWGDEISGFGDTGASFMYVENCSVSIEGGTFSDQGAWGSEGISAAYFRNCEKVIINGVDFSDNDNGDLVSNEKDGILRFDNCSNVSITDSIFENNNSASAVISVLGGSNVSLSGSTLSQNHSGKGSVYVGKGGTITIESTTIKEETVSSGLYAANGGKATMESGALYGSISDVTIEAGAAAKIPAASEMTLSDELKADYNLWFLQEDSGENKRINGELNFLSADKQYRYKAGAIKVDEA